VTNILIFGVENTGRTAGELCAEMAKRKVLCNPTGKYAIRMVTHYDVDRAGIDRALAAMAEVCAPSSVSCQS
jgi:threonine aldolase